jgi:plasmid stability protein
VSSVLNVPDEVARRLQDAATSRGVSVESAVVEALTAWTERDDATMPELTFVGIGEGRPDLAESHDESWREQLRGAS